MMSVLYRNKMFNWIFIVLDHRNNSAQVDMFLHSDILSCNLDNQSLLFSREAVNTNVIVFGLTSWPGPESTDYCTQCEHANHYTTVQFVLFF
jgi:hypothetical protein